MINIPLFTAQTSNHNLQITLTYNATAIKPNQEASWVGLQWSLDCGGLISRTIRGIDDFHPGYGYFNTPALPKSDDGGNYTPLATDNDYDFIIGLVNGARDGDPDVFNYNFAGYSGTFVMDKAVNGGAIYLDKKSNLKLIYTATTQKWMAIDGNGYKYHLGTAEWTEDWSISGNAQYGPIITGLGSMGFDPYWSPSITSWYLDAIEAPNGEKVTFEYTKSESLSGINLSEQEYLPFSYMTNCTGTVQLYAHTYSASRQVISDINLKKINYANGSIEFETSAREDLEYRFENKRPLKLSAIVCKDLVGNRVKKYNFDYGYFGAYNKKLRLNKVTESGSTDASTLPPYKFNYIAGNDLPKSTFAIDYWGYYNNKSNNSLLPEMLLPADGSLLPGANREPELNSNFVGQNLLSEIWFPTGGYTSFTYELNDYSNLQGSEKYVPEPHWVSLVNNNGTFTDKTITFSNPINQIVQIAYAYDENGCQPCGENGPGDAYVIISEADNKFTGVYGQPAGGGSGVATVSLPAGEYTMRVKGYPNYILTGTINYNTYREIDERQGGGVRIQSIISYDNYGNHITKKYEYKKDNGKSSGWMLKRPRYSFWHTTDGVTTNDPYAGMFCSYWGEHFIRTSNTITGNGISSPGNVVGYEKVTEILGDNGEGGKTEYFYYCEEPGVSNYPYIPEIAIPTLGYEKKRVIYDKDNNPVSSTETKYTLSDRTLIKGMQIYKPGFVPATAVGIMANPGALGIQFYENYSNWVHPYQEIITEYTNQGNMVSTKSMEFNNPIHKLTTAYQSTNSKNETERIVFLYPQDKVAHQQDPNGIYAAMVTANIHNPVIEQNRMVNGSSAQKVRLNYGKVTPDQLIKPISREEGMLNGEMQLTEKFQQYDNTGNITVSTGKNGITSVYLWSYKKQVPVAQITNADLNIIQDILGVSNIENFSNSIPTAVTIDNFLAPLFTDARMKQSSITTYGYSSSLQLISSKDQRGLQSVYEYDNNGRLKTIRDLNGNILKSFFYSLGQPQP